MQSAVCATLRQRLTILVALGAALNEIKFYGRSESRGPFSYYRMPYRFDSDLWHFNVTHCSLSFFEVPQKWRYFQSQHLP